MVVYKAMIIKTVSDLRFIVRTMDTLAEFWKIEDSVLNGDLRNCLRTERLKDVQRKVHQTLMHSSTAKEQFLAHREALIRTIPRLNNIGTRYESPNLTYEIKQQYDVEYETGWIDLRLSINDDLNQSHQIIIDKLKEQAISLINPICWVKFVLQLPFLVAQEILPPLKNVTEGWHTLLGTVFLGIGWLIAKLWPYFQVWLDKVIGK